MLLTIQQDNHDSIDFMNIIIFMYYLPMILDVWAVRFFGKKEAGPIPALKLFITTIVW